MKRYNRRHYWAYDTRHPSGWAGTELYGPFKTQSDALAFARMAGEDWFQEQLGDILDTTDLDETTDKLIFCEVAK